MKYGVIDVGGGLRGIYGAGVLDRCLEEDLRFDLCIGVSAGSANMVSYLAGQYGRNKPFYDEYSFRREYMSVHNLIHKHSYLDLGYVYGTLSNAGGENPLDYAALARSPAELCVDVYKRQTRFFLLLLFCLLFFQLPLVEQLDDDAFHLPGRVQRGDQQDRHPWSGTLCQKVRHRLRYPQGQL